MAGQRRRNRELLLRVMMDGVQMHMWAMQSITVKTRAYLAVGAIVAGILIAGLGSAVGLTAGNPGAYELLGRIPTWVLVALCSCGVASITSILVSIRFSLSALRIATLSMIGYERFTRDGESMDWETLARWVDMDEDEIYKHVHNLYFLTMKSMTRDDHRVADHANQGKRFLFAGLCMGFASAVAAFALSVVAGAPPA